MIEVAFPKLNKIINVAFVPYYNNTDRYLIFYGGRGSSKSDFVSKKLIIDCLTSNYFRFVLVRNTYNSIKDSSYQTIKDNIISLGLESLFNFKVNPLEIECMNGNKFLARGLDDPTKLKSLKDPTGAWYEEEIPTESGFNTITTSIRTKKADFLQEIFTINPEVDGDYNDHWFYKKFFGDRLDLTFRAKLTDNVYYSVHHSDYTMNRWLPQEFGEYLESLKNSSNPVNRYYYTIYTKGFWGNKMLGGNFYKMFDRAKSVVEDCEYNPNLPIWLSFDFNVRPGMHALIAQKEGDELRIIDEIKTIEPHNKTSGVCREFTRKYKTHTAGLFVTGDPSGNNEDTRGEQGYNDYKIIRNELNAFSPQIRVDSVHPPVVPRGNFINNIFEFEYKGLRILINKKCVTFINDLINLKEDSDGSKFKQKVKDANTGVTYEKYGHMSDCLDYLICRIWSKEFNSYLNADKSYKTRVGSRMIRAEHEY